MMAMIANISALTLAAINLATPLLCKLPKLENFTLLAYKSSMSSMLALVAFYLAALIATAKSQKAANSLAKIVKIGILVKVVSTIVTQAASLEVLLNRKPHSNVRMSTQMQIFSQNNSLVHSALYLVNVHADITIDIIPS